MHMQMAFIELILTFFRDFRFNSTSLNEEAFDVDGQADGVDRLLKILKADFAWLGEVELRNPPIIHGSKEPRYKNKNCNIHGILSEG